MSEAIALACKTCGGEFIFPEDALIFDCPACGTAHQRPCATGDALADLRRAHQQRAACDFVNAEASYQLVLHSNPDEPEALWGLALCKYGVEYVQDEKSGQRLPVIHFMNRRPFTEDPDCALAIARASDDVRPQYQRDAEYIARIQRGVLASEATGDACDIFLCYKASDAGSPDGHSREFAHAQDLYVALHDADYRVFFAHTTLRRAAGANYEAQIFHALQSAKVMLLVVSDPAFLTSPWVHSEWSRYLERIDAGEDCRLIPLLYDGCDPYALPEAFQRRSIQGLRMDSLTAIDDLRGILGERLKRPAPQVAPTASPEVAPLLRRIFLFLEDGDWDNATAYCEKVLDADPENAHAYLAKLMASLRVTRQEKLRDQARPFDGDPNYRKAVRFADDTLAAELEGINAQIRARNEQAVRDAAYQKADRAFAAAKSAQDFENAAKMFAELGNHRDAPERMKQCSTSRLDLLYAEADRAFAAAKSAQDFANAAKMLAELGSHRDAPERMQQCRTSRLDLLYAEADRAFAAAKSAQDFANAAKMFAELGNHRDAPERMQQCRTSRMEIIYNSALTLMRGTPSVDACNKALRLLKLIPDWRDVPQQIETCQRMMADAETREAAEKAAAKVAFMKNARRVGIGTAALALLTAVVLLVTQVILPYAEYSAAVRLMNAGRYEEAMEAFETMDGYKDSERHIETCEDGVAYNAAVALMNDEKYLEAIAAFEALGSFRDSKDQITNCETAILDGKYADAVALMNAGEYLEAIAAFEALGSFRDSQAQIINCETALYEPDYVSATALMDDGEYEEALKLFDAMNGYKNSAELVSICAYSQAEIYLDEGKTALAAMRFGKAGDYSDAPARSTELWNSLPGLHTIAATWRHTAGLREDGTVVAQGARDREFSTTSDWTRIVSIATNTYNIFGLRADGTVIATPYGRGDKDFADWTDIASIAANEHLIIGLRADGTVLFHRFDGVFPLHGTFSDWTNIVAIATGGYHDILPTGRPHIVGLRSDGTVVAAGENNCGQCDVSDWTDIVAIAAGNVHTVGLRSDGTVITAGTASLCRCDVSDWTDIVAIDAGNSFIVGLRSDGTVITTGDFDFESDVAGMKDVIAIVAAGNDIVALRKDGTVIAAGYNDFGELDAGSLRNIFPRPTLPITLPTK